MASSNEEWLILATTPFYICIIIFEIILSNISHKNWYSVKDTITNLYFMLLNSGIDLLFRVVSFAVLIYFYQHRFFQIEHRFLYWVILFISEDFLYYWLHRFDHTVRLFWAVHVTHHSSEKFNLSVGFRSSVFQPLYRFIWFIPLALLGFSPLDIAFVYAATQIWGILVHTQWIGNLGFLEYFLVTPSHHRVHHASNIMYLDKNMGMFLIIWDKIFGTFQPELSENKYEKLCFGLTKNLEHKNPFNIIFHEFKSIFHDVMYKKTNFKNKLKYIFFPPGWSHDNSSKTSEMLRKEYLENNTLLKN